MNNNTYKTIFRMSQAGKCPRALSAQYLGYKAIPMPKWVEASAEEGKWHETRIIDMLRNEDINVIDCQKEIQLHFPSFILVGHIDGIIDKQLLEIKSMSQFQFDKWIRNGFSEFSQYADQITCYMEATNLKECLYIVKNRSTGSKNERILHESPSFMTEILGRLTDTNNHILDHKLVEKEFNSDSAQCRMCEYRNLCVIEQKELSPVQQINLTKAAELWRKGKELVNKGDELVNEARSIFEQHSKATKMDKWQYNNLGIQLVNIKENVSYPKANLLKYFTVSELAPASQVKKAYSQLKITDLDIKEE